MEEALKMVKIIVEWMNGESSYTSSELNQMCEEKGLSYTNLKQAASYIYEEI